MNFLVWLRSIAAAFVGGVANTVTVIVIDPVAFNFGAQWKKTFAAALTGGVLAVAAYLQKSPFPVQTELHTQTEESNK